MPRYRLYRGVIAGTTGRVGSILTNQLLLSPLCSEVHVLGRHATKSFDALSASAKMRQHQADLTKPCLGVDTEVFAGADAAFCVLGSRRGWADPELAAVERDGVVRFAEACASAQVPHFSLLSSAWASKDSKMAFGRFQAEASDLVTKMTFQRVSVFKPAVLLDSAGDAVVASHGSPYDKLWKRMPTCVQFLSGRFRPLSIPDVALGMRLNAEMCDATERVEYLDFDQIMKIIGKEGPA